jgi:hypothetical protein
VGRHCCWNGEKVSVSLVVDGGSSNAQTPGPKTGDSEGAVVWILLIALWNPSSTSTRGLPPDPAGGFWTISLFFLVERCLPPCLNLRLDLVFFKSRCFCPRRAVVVAYVGPLFLPSSGHFFYLRLISMF